MATLTSATCVAWVPRGKAAANPYVVRLNEGDVEKMKANVLASLAAIDGSGPAAPASSLLPPTQPNEGDIFNMAGYDDSDDEDAGVGVGIEGHMYYKSNAEDPYLQNADDSEESDIEDFSVGPNDSLLCCGRVNDGDSIVEVFTYDRDGYQSPHDQLYLERWPLCLAWTDLNPATGGRDGNILAVGLIEPYDIDIYNLNVVNSVEPIARLLSGKATQHLPEASRGHTGSVIDMDFNSITGVHLATASADKTVKCWDVTTQQCVFTLTHHTNEVTCAVWNPVEENILATASADGTVNVIDVRARVAGVRAQIPAPPECLKWNPFTPLCFVVSCEDGTVLQHDARDSNVNSHTFSFAAHHANVSALTLSAGVSGLMVTGSHDKTLKVWDVAAAPKLVKTISTNPEEPIFACELSPDDPFTLAYAGKEGTLSVVDLSTRPAVRAAFSDRYNIERPGEGDIASDDEETAALQEAEELAFAGRPAAAAAVKATAKAKARARQNKKKKKKKKGRS